MDARQADVRLQSITAQHAGSQPLSPRVALAAFSDFAREVATYEDGGVGEDLVRVHTSTLEPSQPWPNDEVRPPVGALVIEFSRDLNIYDEDGEHQEWADVGARLALPPMANDLLAEHISREAPAGADAMPTGPDSLDTFVEKTTAALGDLIDIPATHTFVGGDVPTTPPASLLATPAARPLRIHLTDDGWEDIDYGEGDLEDALRSRRTPGHERDTQRALSIMVAFCIRPIEPGEAQIMRDELIVTWSPASPDDHQGESRLRFERSYKLTHPDSEYDWSDTVDFTLAYPPSDATRAAGDRVVFRAPAATCPGGQLAPEPYPMASFIDLPTAHEIEARMRSAGFDALLDQRAAHIKGPCPS